MLKNVDELKELIVWMKTQKVASIKIDSIEVQLSQYAFIEGLVSEATTPTVAKLTEQDETAEAAAARLQKEYEADLFHSVR